MSVVVSFGYVNAEGLNDTASVSPSDTVTGTALRDLVDAAFASLSETALWVDGSPPELVAEVAARLSLPIGEPDGWTDGA